MTSNSCIQAVCSYMSKTTVWVIINANVLFLKMINYKVNVSLLPHTKPILKEMDTVQNCSVVSVKWQKSRLHMSEFRQQEVSVGYSCNQQQIMCLFFFFFFILFYFFNVFIFPVYLHCLCKKLQEDPSSAEICDLPPILSTSLMPLRGRFSDQRTSKIRHIFQKCSDSKSLKAKLSHDGQNDQKLPHKQPSHDIPSS